MPLGAARFGLQGAAGGFDVQYLIVSGGGGAEIGGGGGGGAVDNV